MLNLQVNWTFVGDTS